MAKVATLVTYEQAKELLHRAVQERGEDYVYTATDPERGCIYFEDDGTPSCIVGLVLSYLGYTKDDLVKGDRDFNSGNGVNGLACYGLVAFDMRARNLLTHVQTRQDGRVPWGKAVSDSIALMETPAPWEVA